MTEFSQERTASIFRVIIVLIMEEKSTFDSSVIVYWTDWRSFLEGSHLYT
jgi:hypothetical protein